MRLTWIVMLIGCAGCTMNNPAFMASATGGESSGDIGGSEGGGSTGRPPAESTGDAPTTTATPGTTTSTATTATTGEPVSSSEPGTTGLESTGVGETQTATTTDPNASTGQPGSTGNPAPVCGDGNTDPGEECDSPGDELLPGHCAPNCQVIPEKLIFALPETITGNFAKGTNLTVLDEKCTAKAMENGISGTFKVLIADGETRFGAMDPLDGKCDPGWPIAPYTAYHNRLGELVWVTDEVRLLGVRAGNPNQGKSLLKPIEPQFAIVVWTGMKKTWQTNNHCLKWQGGDNTSGTAGKTLQTGLEFLDAAGDRQCFEPHGVICVEQ